MIDKIKATKSIVFTITSDSTLLQAIHISRFLDDEYKLFLLILVDDEEILYGLASILEDSDERSRFVVLNDFPLDQAMKFFNVIVISQINQSVRQFLRNNRWIAGGRAAIVSLGLGLDLSWKLTLINRWFADYFVLTYPASKLSLYDKFKNLLIPPPKLVGYNPYFYVEDHRSERVLEEIENVVLFYQNVFPKDFSIRDSLIVDYLQLARRFPSIRFYVKLRNKKGEKALESDNEIMHVEDHFSMHGKIPDNLYFDSSANLNSLTRAIYISVSSTATFQQASKGYVSFIVEDYLEDFYGEWFLNNFPSEMKISMEQLASALDNGVKQNISNGVVGSVLHTVSPRELFDNIIQDWKRRKTPKGMFDKHFIRNRKLSVRFKELIVSKVLRR